jgi:hypothetical protein
MSVLNDLKTEIANYPIDNVEIDIKDVRGVDMPGDPAGGHINVNEVWSFSVEIHNKGHLHMKGLKVHAQGTAWASVAYWTPSGFSSSAISSPTDVNAHQTVKFDFFYLQADAATPSGGSQSEDIIKAHISNWDADLENILGFHAGHSPNPEESYSRHIHTIRDSVD